MPEIETPTDDADLHPRGQCMDERDDSPCQGPVAYHSVDPGRATAVERCAKHWADRLDRMSNSVERYANSDLAPSWFDPSFAGERWDDE